MERLARGMVGYDPRVTAWAFNEDSTGWVGSYCAAYLTHGWCVVRRTGTHKVADRPTEAGPFDTEEEAKAVLTAMHRMGG